MLALLIVHTRHQHGGLGIVVVVVIIGVIGASVASRRRHRRNGGSNEGTTQLAENDTMSNSAEERALSEQFGRGELTLSEYHANLAALRGRSRGSDAQS